MNSRSKPNHSPELIHANLKPNFRDRLSGFFQHSRRFGWDLLGTFLLLLFILSFLGLSGLVIPE
jgi:hypothetical protein